MSNRTVQAAAEGMPKRDYGALESALSDAHMAAHLTVYVAERALPDDSGASSLVKTTTWERDLLLFAADQAKEAAGNALDELAAFLETAR